MVWAGRCWLRSSPGAGETHSLLLFLFSPLTWLNSPPPFFFLGGGRAKCGYASLADVDTGKRRDHMESFFLAETLKYLYLLFDAGARGLWREHRVVRHLPYDYVFSTEGHIFPLTNSLSAFGKPGKLDTRPLNSDCRGRESGCGDVLEGYCRCDAFALPPSPSAPLTPFLLSFAQRASPSGPSTPSGMPQDTPGTTFPSRRRWPSLPGGRRLRRGSPPLAPPKGRRAFSTSRPC